MGIIPSEKTCYVCGKEFIGFDQWAFKRGDKWFCKWSHLNKYEQDVKSRSCRRLQYEERVKIREMLSDGIDIQKIARKMDINVKTIKYYQKQLGGVSHV